MVIIGYLTVVVLWRQICELIFVIHGLVRHQSYSVLSSRNTRCNQFNPWASCQIRKIAGCACAGNAGNVFPPPARVSDPDMHHGRCVTHVPWCMQGSPYLRFPLKSVMGKTCPAFPAHAQPAILRIWQEAHFITWFDHVGTVYCQKLSKPPSPFAPPIPQRNVLSCLVFNQPDAIQCVAINMLSVVTRSMWLSGLTVY